MKLLNMTLLLSSIFLLPGCVIAVNTDDWEDHADGWYSKQRKNARHIDHLELGKSDEAVRSELGEPNFTESFMRGEDTYLVLYYRTRHMEGDGRTTKDETTPLVFVDGSLVGWGESAIENAAR
jgi:hypothetical protein